MHLFILALSLLSSCSYVHHVQIGDIDDRKSFKKEYFEVKVNEMGLNVDEAGKILKIFATAKGDKTIEKIKGLIALFQMGPRTGNPVYNETYAENILSLIQKECPDGRVSKLSSIREMRKYPVISG